MQFWTRTALMAAVVGVMAFFATPAEAQRTGDHIVPSIETVCDGDPFNFGLCNAYCEALDCESATPLGTPRACSNLLRNYKKKSGGALPPCACPCAFAIQSDLEELIAIAEAEEGFIPVISDDTYVQECGNVPATEDDFIIDGVPQNGLLAEALEFPPGDPNNDPQGVRLIYWLTPGDEENDPTCNEYGVGIDGLNDDFFDESYVGSPPWIERFDIPLTEGEYDACLAALTFLCEEDPN